MIKNFIVITLFLGSTHILHAHESNVEAGKVLYRIYCTQCHGLDSDGWGINAADMEVQPKDHTDTKEMESRTDKDLFKAIKHGGKSVDKSVLMPNWDGNLTDEQISSLVRYLRYVCCKKSEK